MSDAVLSDCPSSAICHTATTHNGILVGRFNLYCNTPSWLSHCSLLANLIKRCMLFQKKAIFRQVVPNTTLLSSVFGQCEPTGCLDSLCSTEI